MAVYIKYFQNVGKTGEDETMDVISIATWYKQLSHL